MANVLVVSVCDVFSLRACTLHRLLVYLGIRNLNRKKRTLTLRYSSSVKIRLFDGWMRTLTPLRTSLLTSRGTTGTRRSHWIKKKETLIQKVVVRKMHWRMTNWSYWKMGQWNRHARTFHREEVCALPIRASAGLEHMCSPFALHRTPCVHTQSNIVHDKQRLAVLD